MIKAIAAAALLGLIGTSLGPMPRAEAQETCAPGPVRATGTPGLIEATAKSKARGAWMRKVRAKKALGAEFGVWLRAKDPSFICRKEARRVVCVASAIPCKI